MLLHPQLTAGLVYFRISDTTHRRFVHAVEDVPLPHELLPALPKLVERDVWMSEVQILEILLSQTFQSLTTKSQQIIGNSALRAHQVHCMQTQNTTGVPENMTEGCGEAALDHDVTDLEWSYLTKDPINHCGSLRSIRPVRSQLVETCDIPEIARSAYGTNAPPAQQVGSIPRLKRGIACTTR